MSGKPLVFFGSSLVSSYWNGAATYYRGILRALHEQFDWRITFCEPDAYGRQQNRDLTEDPDYAQVVVYPGDWTAEDDLTRFVSEQINQAAVIVKASGVGVYDAALERLVLAQRRPDQVVVFWDVDAPATLERVQNDSNDPFRALIPEYDAVLTYGGGPPVVEAYTALGARRCIPVYNGLDPKTHHPAPPQGDRFTADLAFLGNRLPDREARVEEFFLKPAALLPEKQFLLGGSGWQDKSLPPHVRYLGHVATADHNAFNTTPLAVLNVARDSMARTGYSPATRVFEAAGAGACLITDHWEGVETFFVPGREILVAEDGAQVAALLRDLTLEQARAIGEAARCRALAEHTYARRADLANAALCELLTARGSL